MKFMMECLNHHYPSFELTTTKAIRLGPSYNEAPFCRVEAYPDYKNGKVRIKNLGSTKCLLNFQHVLSKGDELSGVPGDIIDLTFATFLYRIRKIDHTSLAEKPLSIQENKSRLDIILKPQLSMMISEDISSSMMSQSDHYENDSISSADGSGTSGSSRSSGLTENKQTKNFEWQSFSGTLGRLSVLVHGENMQKMNRKVMGFDLDGTIIVPEPGRWAKLKAISSQKGSTSKGKMIIPRPTGLWKFAFDNVKETLKKFCQTHPDHKFLIVTNKSNSNFEASMMIIEEVVLELDIPVIVFAAREGTQFLKPAPCCWEIYRQNFNEGVDPIWKQSFFCGDAAGRPGDISKGDRLFALNSGLAFKTPEEFFKGAVQDEKLFQMPSFIPKDVVHTLLNNDHIKFPSEHDCEMVLMCGLPGSGKSWFIETTLVPKGYFHVHPTSEMSTSKKRMQAAADALTKGSNVVVDKRNADKEDRIICIRMATALHIPVRCFHMNVSPEQALHNLRFHELRTGQVLNPSEVELGMKRYKGLYEPPTIDEGFSEIVPVNFVPQSVLNPTQLHLYSKFLIPR